MYPRDEFTFEKRRCLGGLDFYLVLVEGRDDHFDENHEIGYCAGHVAYIIGISHLHGMCNDPGFDLGEDVFQKVRRRGNLDGRKKS